MSLEQTGLVERPPCCLCEKNAVPEGHSYCIECELDGYMPIRYRGAKITDFEDSIQAELKKAADVGGLIWGDRGIGKTHALWATGRYRFIAGLGKFPRVYSWSALVLRQRGVFQPGAQESEQDIVKELLRPKLLFLDDICDERVELTSSTLAFFVNVFDERYNKGLGVFATSNFGPAPNQLLQQKLSGKVVDRMIHGRSVIELTGKNRRIQ